MTTRASNAYEESLAGLPVHDTSHMPCTPLAHSATQSMAASIKHTEISQPCNTHTAILKLQYKIHFVLSVGAKYTPLRKWKLCHPEKPPAPPPLLKHSLVRHRFSKLSSPSSTRPPPHSWTTTGSGRAGRRRGRRSGH